MAGFNNPDEELIKHIHTQVSPDTYKMYDDKRRELNVTWSKFVQDAVNAMYFGEEKK